LIETHFVNDSGQIVVVGQVPSGDIHVVIMTPCDDDEWDGCRGAKEEKPVANAVATSATLSRKGVTKEEITALRARLTRRFAGLTSKK